MLRFWGPAHLDPTGPGASHEHFGTGTRHKVAIFRVRLKNQNCGGLWWSDFHTLIQHATVFYDLHDCFSSAGPFRLLIRRPLFYKSNATRQPAVPVYLSASSMDATLPSEPSAAMLNLSALAYLLGTTIITWCMARVSKKYRLWTKKGWKTMTWPAHCYTELRDTIARIGVRSASTYAFALYGEPHTKDGNRLFIFFASPWYCRINVVTNAAGLYWALQGPDESTCSWDRSVHISSIGNIASPQPGAAHAVAVNRDLSEMLDEPSQQDDPFEDGSGVTTYELALYVSDLQRPDPIVQSAVREKLVVSPPLSNGTNKMPQELQVGGICPTICVCSCSSRMKRNPRKVKWTKAFRKAAGKEMTIVRLYIRIRKEAQYSGPLQPRTCANNSQGHTASYRGSCQTREGILEGSYGGGKREAVGGEDAKETGSKQEGYKHGSRERGSGRRGRDGRSYARRPSGANPKGGLTRKSQNCHQVGTKKKEECSCTRRGHEYEYGCRLNGIGLLGFHRM
ncbi:ribosomal l24e domain-containing protein [Rhizoctonia solani AG-1 IA]|uniref:Ribosomal l24e domain-containing protein n=1 Tax=Thanatephorus cucumeris (strain AG1-IA) TaxID=983506 RepID=L8WL01_THACA|nr:ribosomal l24e domain-containing protein [Rhizoctonia solani AG-1 IA]